jgi:hypothetical protein
MDYISTDETRSKINHLPVDGSGGLERITPDQQMISNGGREIGEEKC